MSEETKTKTIELEVEIDAPAEAVWNAISDAEEIRRWFAPEAELKPGVGGSLTLGWGPDCTGTARIERWEEGRHLRCVEEWPGEDGAVPVAVDYHIESRGGRTVLRVVNSGFLSGDDWDDCVDTLDSGWHYFLWNLKHYLEQHRGTPRRMVWDRRRIGVPKPQAWERLFGADGLVQGSLPLQEGARLELWSGHPASVQLAAAPIHLGARIEGLNDAALLVELEPGGDVYSLGVWLSLYGLPEAEAAALQESLEATLGRLFESVESLQA